MITARELAEELGATVGDVMTALNDIHELTLTPDSSVRDIAADAVRERLRRNLQTGQSQAVTIRPASDEQLARLRRVLSGEEAAPRQDQTIDLTPHPTVKPQSRPRHWRVGDRPLPKLTRALADQIVDHSGVLRRPPGVIFADEVAEARDRSDLWMRARVEHGVFISDDDIVRWIVAFPNEVLRPKEVFELFAAGLTPRDVKLRLWFGRLNNARLTLLQQIRRGDLSIEKAAADVAEFNRRQSAG